MIKAFAIAIFLTVAGSSISEFSLSPSESFVIHAQHDYQFSLMDCGADCVSVQVSQIEGGESIWTGQLFDLKVGKQYPMNMEFEDILFDTLIVVSADDEVILRIQYRESSPVLTNERLVKATAEKETTGKISWIIIGEVSAVILLVFFVVHRYLHRKTPRIEEPEDVPPRVPRPLVGFHDTWEPGIPRHEEEDPDLELLEHIRKLNRLKEEEMQQRMWRRMDEEDRLGLEWV
jgi:hypothetical protein